jgi:hypothetical protein
MLERCYTQLLYSASEALQRTIRIRGKSCTSVRCDTQRNAALDDDDEEEAQRPRVTPGTSGKPRGGRGPRAGS